MMSETNETSFLYIIQIETGPIKVGITNNINQRLDAYRTMNPYRFHVVWTCPGTYQDETRLLRFLKAHIIQGEWVSNTPEVRKIMSTFVGVENLDFSAINRTRPRKSVKHSNDFVHIARRRLADGKEKVYYYHTRSGTRLPDDPDSPEFREALEEAKRAPAFKYHSQGRLRVPVPLHSSVEGEG